MSDKTIEKGVVSFTPQTSKNTFYYIIKQLYDAGVKEFEASITGETVAKDIITGIISHSDGAYWPIFESDTKIIEDKISVYWEHANETIAFSVSYVKPNTFFKLDFTAQKN